MSLKKKNVSTLVEYLSSTPGQLLSHTKCFVYIFGGWASEDDTPPPNDR